jgi:hypothetical protein
MFMWPRPFPLLTITVRCWPGVHSPQIDEVPVYQGRGTPLIGEKDTFSAKNMLPSRWGFGVKNRSFKVFSLGQEIPKTIFGLWWPSLSHNLSLTQYKGAPNGNRGQVCFDRTVL